jgi:hypothetical protein
MAGGGLLPRGRPDTSLQKQRFRLQQLVQNADTDDDLLEVWDHVKDMAKTSTDIQWASLYLAYRLGKPASMDPSQVSGIVVDGDLSLTINQLSLEQIRQAQKAIETLDATFAPVEPHALPSAH